MIRHIVLVHFQPTVSAGVVEDLFAELYQIEGKPPGLDGILVFDLPVQTQGSLT